MYKPGAKELSYYQQLTVKVETSHETESGNSYNNLYRADERTRNMIKGLIQNESTMTKYPVSSGSKPKYDYDIDYLIITSDAYVDDFSEFVIFKKLQGF